MYEITDIIKMSKERVRHILHQDSHIKKICAEWMPRSLSIALKPPAHTCLKAIAKSNKLKYELLPHPPYTPEMVPSNFYLLLNMRRWLQGRRFQSNEEFKWETNAYFKAYSKSFICSLSAFHNYSFNIL